MDPGRSGFGVSSRAGRVAGAVGRRSVTSALLAVLMALFLVGGSALPYRDGQFQLVTLQLSSIPDRAREELLREAARVLARGGSLLVLDYGRASRDEVLLRACGLRVRRVRPGPRGRPGGLLVPPAAVVAAG